MSNVKTPYSNEQCKAAVFLYIEFFPRYTAPPTVQVCELASHIWISENINICSLEGNLWQKYFEGIADLKLAGAGVLSLNP